MLLVKMTAAVYVKAAELDRSRASMQAGTPGGAESDTPKTQH